MTRVLKLPFLILLLVAVVAVTNYYTYQHTRASYHAVGLNDGAIHAKNQVLEKIKALDGGLPECTLINTESNIVKLLSVKSHELFVVRQLNGLVALCRKHRETNGA